MASSDCPLRAGLWCAPTGAASPASPRSASRSPSTRASTRRWSRRREPCWRSSRGSTPTPRATRSPSCSPGTTRSSRAGSRSSSPSPPGSPARPSRTTSARQLTSTPACGSAPARRRSPGQATAALDGRTFDEKRELLERHGVQLDALPGWQRQGVGLYPETFLKRGFDPRSREEVLVARRRVRVEETLPTGDAYARFLAPLLSPSVADRP